MPAFASAKCPNCGGDLQVPNDRDTVKCMYCSGDVIVRQAIMSAQGGNVQNWMTLAIAAADAGNHEEAVAHLNKVLEVHPSNHEAWFLKAESTGWLSNLLNCRLSEMVSHMEHAIQCAPDNDINDVKAAAALMINEVAVAYYDIVCKHFMEFVTVDSSWPEFLDQAVAAFEAWDAAHKMNPENKVILQNIIKLLTELIQGVAYDDTDEYGRFTRKVHQVTPEYSEKMTELKVEYDEKLKALDPTYQPQALKVAKVGVGQNILSVMRFFGATKY